MQIDAVETFQFYFELTRQLSDNFVSFHSFTTVLDYVNVSNFISEAKPYHSPFFPITKLGTHRTLKCFQNFGDAQLHR